jgi:hypothetical protein
MRTLLLSLAMCAALAACKKDNKPAAGEATGSAAAAATAGSNALAAAGSAMEAAGQAAAAAGSAAAGAGSAAEAAGNAAQAGANAAAAAAEMAGAAADGAAQNVARPASVTDAHVKVADRLIVQMQKMGAEVTAAGKDCAKAAAAVQANSKELEPIKAEIESMEKATKKDPQAEAWFKANYANKVVKSLTPIFDLAKTCGTDPTFRESMKSLGKIGG